MPSQADKDLADYLDEVTKPEPVEATIDRILEVPEGVKRALSSFPFPQHPGAAVELPADVSKMHGKELGELMGRLSAWVSYAEAQLAEAEVQLEAHRYAHTLSEAQYVLTNRNVTVRVGTIKKAERRTDTELKQAFATGSGRKLGLKELEWEARARLLKGLLHGYNQKYGLLSREVTRRGSSGGVGGKGGLDE